MHWMQWVSLHKQALGSNLISQTKQWNNKTLNSRVFAISLLNRLSICFDADQTKLWFSLPSKHQDRKILHEAINWIQIKTMMKVMLSRKYVSWGHVCRTSSLQNITKVNWLLYILYRENKFLTPELNDYYVNAVFQSRFDYACSAFVSPSN